MWSRHVHPRRMALQDEVKELQQRLSGELKLSTVLHYAINGHVLSCPCLSPLLPPKAKVLLAELAEVEEEIEWLENQVQMLKGRLHREHRRNKHLAHLSSSSAAPLLARFQRGFVAEERFSVSSTDSCFIPSISSTPSRDTDLNQEDPNRLSEELLRHLISIFLKMNSNKPETEGSHSSSSKYNNAVSCIKSRGFTQKPTFNCKTRPSYNSKTTLFPRDPNSILYDADNSMAKDGGPYKNYVQVTRSSWNAAWLSECGSATRKLRVLLQKLCSVDLSNLNYRQKLAFWINIYNSCIMNGYLHHGLPSSHERMLELMNKAALNVGGIVLNALAIEHYILRHPCDSKYEGTDNREILLRHAYGLQYPEPNVTFALCRGNWSSPSLRIYTSDEVADELSKAKVEYLEASVGVTSKKKIMVPKLLEWHMHDFADDVASLVEWIYSQLPHVAPLKRSMMECLNGDKKLPKEKMVEILDYDYEFRYLLPSL